MNPYTGTSFLSFFFVLIRRLFSFEGLASDELQVLVLMAVAISGALVGSFLVLRKMAMLANSLSHTILLGIVIAFLCTRSEGGEYIPLNITAMLIAALITGLVTTFLTQFLSGPIALQKDAANGLVFTTLFSLGIVLVTLYTRNAHIGVEAVYGNVDALQPKDLTLVSLILAGNFLLITLLFRGYQLTTFDPRYAKSLGLSNGIFNYLLMIQTSATAVAGFRAVGVLMVLAFIVGPSLAARRLTHRLIPLLLLASAFGALAALLGVATARHFISLYNIPLSTAGLTVCWIVLIYTMCCISPRKRLKSA